VPSPHHALRRHPLFCPFPKKLRNLLSPFPIKNLWATLQSAVAQIFRGPTTIFFSNRHFHAEGAVVDCSLHELYINIVWPLTLDMRLPLSLTLIPSPIFNTCSPMLSSILPPPTFPLLTFWESYPTLCLFPRHSFPSGTRHQFRTPTGGKCPCEPNEQRSSPLVGDS